MAIARLLPIALVACALLLYEVAITRILSVVLWYHFAFLSVSLAMLGVGAPGVWFAIRAPGRRALEGSMLAASVSLPLSVVAILRLRPAVEGLALGENAWVVVVVAALLVPMLALGSAICILLIEAHGRQIGATYGADLLGAMLGAVLTPPLLNVVPTPQLVASLALLPLAALSCIRGRLSRGALLVALALIAVLVVREPFEVIYNKSYSERLKRPVLARWTPTARITLFDHPIWARNPDLPWLWGMGERFTPRRLKQMWIDQDGSAGMPIEQFAGDVSVPNHLLFDVTSIGYQWRTPDRVCVIGAGGGRDVLTALVAGATTVDAVELNPTTVDIVSRVTKPFSGDVYHHPGVRAVIGEGRSFLTRTPGPYDLVQISLVDSWAATSAGAYALSENYLYTVEALQLYWERLSERGVVSISRWTGGQQQLEGARLAYLAREALARRGVVQPEQHLAFVESGWVGTLLVSRQALTPADLARIDSICVARGFRRRWPMAPGGTGSAVTTVLSEGIDRFTRIGLDFTPPTDDRPFFFQTVSLIRRQPDPSLLGVNERSVTLLRGVVIGLALLATTLFFLPFLVGRRVRKQADLARGSAYFAAIGLGFMCVEMPWIQRSILLLGHPTYATSVVLGVLLLGAGLGSFTAGRLEPRAVFRWRFILPVVIAGAYVLSMFLFRATLGMPYGWRLATVVALLFPSGWVMGFAFPFGMMRFGDGNKPWYWAINGAFGVLAGALSLALAMILGFGGVVALGLTAYVVAVILAGGQPASRTAARGS